MTSFELTPEQRLLRDGLSDFLRDRYERSRAGWQPTVWKAFADELGILGINLPESAGGSGGPAELMVVAEALGKYLVAEPFVDTVVIGGGLLHRLGGPRATAVLRRIVAGHAVVAFAGPATSTVTAHGDGDGWVLDGTASVVTSAPLATDLLVAADGGTSVFLVDPRAAGLTTHPGRTLDDRTAADLAFASVRLPAEALLGAEGSAATVIERVVDEAIAATCAEAVGGLRTVLADTVTYTRQRRQFGQPISSFQVLQHRMVDMHMEVEQAVAATYLAFSALDADAPERARAVSAAKVTIARAARFVAQNAVQLHGAIGMTEELALGHYVKRLTAVEYEFGPAAQHLTRYAKLTR